MGLHGLIVEDDHVPVFERGKNKLHVALVFVVSMGNCKRVKHTPIDIGRCPARPGDVLICGDPNLELLEQRSFGPISMGVAPVAVAGPEKVDQMNDCPSILLADEGPDSVWH